MSVSSALEWKYTHSAFSSLATARKQNSTKHQEHNEQMNKEQWKTHIVCRNIVQ